MTSQTIVVLAATALLATAPPAHAFVTCPTASQPRALPSLTSLHYQDRMGVSAEEGPALHHIRSNSRTIKRRDRQAYFEAASTSSDGPLEHLVLETSSATLSPLSATVAEEARPRPGSRLLSLPSAVASLLLEAQTVGEDDRRAYFEFVQAQNLKP